MLIRSQAVGPVLATAKAAGADVTALMKRFSLDETALTSVLYELEVTSLRELFAAAAEACGDDAFGVRVALNLPRGRYGLVEYGTFNAPTLGDAVRRLVRLSALVNASARYAVEEGRDSWKLTQRCSAQFRDGLGRHGNEFNVVAILQMGRAVLREAWAPTSAWFSSSKPSSTAALEKALGTNKIQWDADSNGIELPLDLVHRAVPAADPALLALMDRYAEQELAALPRGNDLVERTAHAIRRALHAGAPRMRDVARELKMSERTLQRRLEAERSSFAKVLETVREQLALHHVKNTRAPLAEVAFTLGYADMPSFFRAFKRWTSKRPGDFRKSSS